MSKRPTALSPRLANKVKAKHKAQAADDDGWFEEPEGAVASSSASPTKPRAPPSPFRPKAQLARTPVANKRGPIPSYTSESPPSSPNSTPIRRPRTHAAAPALPPRAPVLDTLNLLLLPVRMLFQAISSILLTFLSPFIAHLINLLFLLTIIGLTGWFLGPWLASTALSAAGWPLRLVLSAITGRVEEFKTALNPFSGGLVPMMNGTSLVCLVAPGLCVMGGEGRLEVDVWGNKRRGKGGEVNVANVARALSKEVRDARDIFDSVERLGRGGQDGGFHHLRIWELATTIKVASNLPDKDHLAQQVADLGDLSRNLSDEVSRLAALNINTFSWCSHEFDRLTQLLSTLGTPPAKLEALLHSLMVRLETNLDNLYLATERAIPHADAASALGGSIMEDMTRETERLKISIGRAPGWKKLSEKAVAFAVGKPEPSRLDILDRDLKMSRLTVSNLKDVRQGLEETRRQLVVHRDQVGQFKGGLMGFHIGAEAGGLEPQEELMVLASVVEDMKKAVRVSKSGYDRLAQGKVEVEVKALPPPGGV